MKLALATIARRFADWLHPAGSAALAYARGHDDGFEAGVAADELRRRGLLEQVGDGIEARVGELPGRIVYPKQKPKLVDSNVAEITSGPRVMRRRKPRGK